jgi:hypothetical protein
MEKEKIVESQPGRVKKRATRMEKKFGAWHVSTVAVSLCV